MVWLHRVWQLHLLLIGPREVHKKSASSHEVTVCRLTHPWSARSVVLVMLLWLCQSRCVGAVGAGQSPVVDGPNGALPPTAIVVLGDELPHKLRWCCLVSGQMLDPCTGSSVEGQFGQTPDLGGTPATECILSAAAREHRTSPSLHSDGIHCGGGIPESGRRRYSWGNQVCGSGNGGWAVSL